MIGLAVAFLIGFFVGGIIVSASHMASINDDIRLQMAHKEYTRRTGRWPGNWAKRGDKDE